MLFDNFYATAVNDVNDNYPELASEIFAAQSDEDRYNLVVPVLEKYKFPSQIPAHLKREKSSEKSGKLRETGNRHFGQGMMYAALRAYTESIAVAPPGSEALSLAYGNRSAVLKRMGLFKECIEEIDRTLGMHNMHMGYVQAAKTVSKLCTRKDDCLLELSKKAASEEKARKKQEECVKDSDLDIAGLSLKEDKKLPVLPELSYGANPELSGASDCLALRYNKELGRHIVATRDIDPGDVLIVERPYAAFLEAPYFYTHCNVCLKRCPSLLPCEKCTWAMFCSEDCRLSAPHHSLECSLMPKLLAWNMGNLSFLVARIVSKEGEEKILTYLDNLPANDDPRTQGFTDGKLKPNFQALYHLERNSKLRTPSNLLRFCVTAFCLVKVMALPPRFGSFMVRLQQLVAVNVFDVSEHFMSLNGEENDNSLAPAVRISSSMLSHSCSPNVTQVAHTDNVEVFYALQPMKQGDLVTISYGWHFMFCPKAERQEQGLTDYQFQCRCEACVEDWPLGAESPWEILPLTFRNSADRVACGVAVESVMDLLLDVQNGKELSAKDAARIGRFLKTMWSLGATKCLHYHANLVYFDQCLARTGSCFKETL